MSRILPILIVCGMPVCAWAELGVENRLIQLGEIKGGINLRRQLRFFNAGAVPIEIVEIKTSCGCLAPRLENKFLGPGERTAIDLEIRPRGQADGPHAWNGLIRYRIGPETRTTPFSVRATVINDVIVQPLVLALYGSNVSRELIVTDRRTPPLQVTDVRTSTPLLHAKIVKQSEGTTKILVWSEKEKQPKDRIDAVVDIFTTDPVYDSWRVPVTLIPSSRAPCVVSPEKVALRLEPGQTQASALVRLRPRDGQRLVIEKVVPSHGSLSCTWAADGEGGVVLRVRYRGEGGAEPAQEACLRVHLSEPAGEIIGIPVDLKHE